MNRAYRLLNVEGRWAGAQLDGLVVDQSGSLVLAPTPAPTPDPAPGPRAGSFRAPPASFPQVTAWGLVRAELADPDAGHLQLLTCATDAEAEPPPLPAAGQATGLSGPEAEADTAAGQWRAAPLDAAALLALCVPARRLWVGGWLYAEDARSPALRQIRVEAAQDGWLELLPAIYRRDPAGRRLLSQLLALLGSELDVVRARLADLPRLFDPLAAPDDCEEPTALDRLAGWVGIELAEARGGDPGARYRRRQLVATAIPSGALRGTRDGLRSAVADATGVRVQVEEPGSWCSLWPLGGSALGVSTMLPVANPGGAVLGSTATLGAVRLVDGAAYGAPALAGLAGRVTVTTTAAELGGRREAVTQVLDLERPAYARIHLCAVEPRMRVGAQCRVGIDTVVAGPPQPPPSTVERRIDDSSTEESSR